MRPHDVCGDGPLPVAKRSLWSGKSPGPRPLLLLRRRCGGPDAYTPVLSVLGRNRQESRRHAETGGVLRAGTTDEEYSQGREGRLSNGVLLVDAADFRRGGFRPSRAFSAPRPQRFSTWSSAPDRSRPSAFAKRAYLYTPDSAGGSRNPE